MIIKPKITENDVLAIRALIANKASEDQQRVGMLWIMQQASRVPDISFHPDGDERSTNFAEGRRYVGALIREMLEPETLTMARKNEKPKTTRGT